LEVYGVEVLYVGPGELALTGGAVSTELGGRIGNREAEQSGIESVRWDFEQMSYRQQKAALTCLVIYGEQWIVQGVSARVTHGRRANVLAFGSASARLWASINHHYKHSPNTTLNHALRSLHRALPSARTHRLCVLPSTRLRDLVLW
jgi:hypothetical protein